MLIYRDITKNFRIPAQTKSPTKLKFWVTQFFFQAELNINIEIFVVDQSDHLRSV